MLLRTTRRRLLTTKSHSIQVQLQKSYRAMRAALEELRAAHVDASRAHPLPQRRHSDGAVGCF